MIECKYNQVDLVIMLVSKPTSPFSSTFPNTDKFFANTVFKDKA